MKNSIRLYVRSLPIRRYVSIVLVCIVLAGCKLRIFSGPGGSVHFGSKDGVLCDPECTIDTREANGEQYFAVAAQGFAFSHWLGASEFCTIGGRGICTIEKAPTLGDEAIDSIEVGLLGVFEILSPYAGSYDVTGVNSTTDSFVVAEHGQIVWRQSMQPKNGGGFLIETQLVGRIRANGSFTFALQGLDTMTPKIPSEFNGIVHPDGSLSIDEFIVNIAAMDVYFGPWNGMITNLEISNNFVDAVSTFDIVFPGNNGSP